jgi:hypothetical protein
MTDWFWAGLLTGIAANECCAVSEWTARKLVRWSAHVRYGDTERAEIRAQELEAVIADRPGQLFKLFTALCFVFAAMRAWMRRRTETGLSVRVSARGTATLQVVTVGTTVMFIAAAVLIQILLVPPLPQNNGSSPPLQVGQGQLQVEEGQLASLQSRVQAAYKAEATAFEAWQCEMDGLTCGGSSGMVGSGPLAQAKKLAFDRDLSTFESLEAELQTMQRTVAALANGSGLSSRFGRVFCLQCSTMARK